MSIQNINTTVTCYKSVTMDKNSVISFNAPFNSIKAISYEKGWAIDNLVIVTQIDFLGTINESLALNNPLELKKTIDFIIRLTKCDRDEEMRLGYDLDIFSVNLDDMYSKNQVKRACFDFLNYTRITNIDQMLNLPGGVGNYVIKILIKNSEDTEYTIQTMSQLSIVEDFKTYAEESK